MSMVAVVCKRAPATNVKQFPSEFKHYDEVYVHKSRKCKKSSDISYFKADFNIKDLIAKEPGKDVTFRVTAIFEYKGRKIAFEGSDSVVALP